MLCPDCGLNNLAHVARCVRCDALLQAAAGPMVDTVPLRAGKWKKHFRTPFYRLRRKIGFRRKNGKAQILPFRSSSSAAVMEGWKKAVGAVLPSFYQFRIGRYIRGTIFLSGMLLGLLLTLLLLGTEYLRFGIFLLVLFHTWAICDMYQFEDRPLWRRLTYSIILSFFVFLGLNFLYVRGMEHIGTRFNLTLAAAGWRGPDIYPGNILKRVPQNHYEVGDLVQIDALVRQYDNQTEWGWRAGMRQENLAIDRILAVPGQTVEIRGNRIYLDDSDTPSPVMPCYPATFRFPDGRFILGLNEYFIHPTVGVWNWQPQFSRIPASFITGKITRVIFPIWRWKRLH